MAFAPAVSAFPVPPQPSESGTGPSRAQRVCLSKSSSRRCWRTLRFENHSVKGPYKWDRFLRSTNDTYLVSKVSVLYSPAWSSLSLDGLTFFSWGTEAQFLLVVQVPQSAATLGFLSPLILYTLGKLTTGQEFAGICLISCKRRADANECMEA